MTTIEPIVATAKDFIPAAAAAAPAEPAAVTTLLALDLGKFKSVACVTDVLTHEHRLKTIDSTPSAVHDLLVGLMPGRLVIEACSISGWVCDVARTLGVAVQVVRTKGT